MPSQKHVLAEVLQETVTAKETAAITQLLQMVGCFYFLFEIGHNLFSDHLFQRRTHDGDCPQFTQESPEFWPWAKTPPVRDWLFPTPEKPEKFPMLCWSCCCCCWAAAACWAAALSACFLVCKKIDSVISKLSNTCFFRYCQFTWYVTQSKMQGQF